MRRLALLLAGGALWILFAAAPASADGGPHRMAVNNGTSGLAGDCAACHRAHTAQAADLLKAQLPGLCLTCHDGTGATADVVDGYQFTPDGSGNPTSTVLGALRGGGFEYALIDTGNASRLSYNSRGSIAVTFGAAPSGSVTLTFPAFGTWASQSITISSPLTVGTIQNAVNAAYGTSTTYTSSTAAGNMSGTQTVMFLVAVSGNVVTFAPHNEFRLYEIPLPVVSNNTTGTTVTVTDGISVGGAGHVGVLAVVDKQAVTSTHEGTGTVWGNGAQGQDNVGATGVVLECTGCHNPHGNGQYRILNTLPGEDWSNGVGGVADWTAPINAVEVADGAPLTGSQVHNYTVKPGYLTSDVVADPLAGDYWRYKYDPSGAANFTNFYLRQDQMNTGWNGAAPTNKAANGNVAPANTSGLMTAWCISCHTRYNGYRVDATTGLIRTASPYSPSSITAQAPIDDVFKYKHGTTGVGCEQCHVNHGSNAAMIAQFSSSYLFPDGTAEDSALLKVNNRGTCNLCHDPTGTVTAGTEVGVVPGAITPGP